MEDLAGFNPNVAGNPHNNIFGLPFTEEDAALVLLPVPWEVTISCSAGTARCADHIFKASMHVDIFDPDVPEAWKKGFFMRDINRKVLLKSDYLRKEAELYLDYVSRGDDVDKNKFMCKSLKEINEGSELMNKWVYDQTRELLSRNKLVGLLGGDHSTALGYWKAQAEKHGDFGILQLDAHCDLRRSYCSFNYSHSSVMYNALKEIPELKKVVQLGVRDFCEEEWSFLNDNKDRVVTFFDRKIKEELYEGKLWRDIADEIVAQLPDKVHISFDVDGLDPKLCPNAAAPVHGGYELEQVLYLFKRVIQSGRTLIGYDLVEVGVGEHNTDANVGAHIIWRLSNLLVKSNLLN